MAHPSPSVALHCACEMKGGYPEANIALDTRKFIVTLSTYCENQLYY